MAAADVELRQVEQEQEYAILRELITEYAVWLGADLSFQNLETELTSLPSMYGPPAGRARIATLGGNVLGCVAVRSLGDDVCEMKRLWVRPHGRGRGTGSKLAGQIIADARELGYRRMRLDTLSTMTPAMTLYRSLGFTECEPYYHNPLPNVVYFEMELTPER